MENASLPTHIKRPADLEGKYGQAWKVAEGPTDLGPANIQTWLVRAPYAHAFWQWYGIYVVHLREAEGLPEVKRHYPEAAYEFAIYTINPEACPAPDPDMGKGFPFLTPFDSIEQFHGLDDEQAMSLCTLAVTNIVNGNAHPDSDFRRGWHTFIAGEVRELATQGRTANG
jgi:hypothetical protein